MNTVLCMGLKFCLSLLYVKSMDKMGILLLYEGGTAILATRYVVHIGISNKEFPYSWVRHGKMTVNGWFNEYHDIFDFAPEKFMRK